MLAHVSLFGRASLASVALLALISCDYPRPARLGGDDVDAASDDGGNADGQPNDAAVTDSNMIDTTPIDAPGTVSVEMTPPTASNTLGTTTHFNVKITSNGYAGTVNLSAAGGAGDWSKSFPSSITLTLGQTQNINFDVGVATNGSAATAGATLTFSATIGSMGPVSDTSTLTIANEYILPIANGVDAGPHWGNLTNLTLRNGSTFTIRNDDATAHQIHASNGIAGLIHQTATMSTGQSYSVVLGSTGTDTIYCHVHGTATGQINITSQ